jgi:acetylornithine deacetylase
LSTLAEEILAKLVGFDTTSRNPNRACIDYCRDYLKACGVESEIIPGDDDGKVCLWATVGHSDKAGVVLAAHTDVVPVDEQSWISDPFALTERDGKLFGRGSADMKGFIACALATVPEFLETNRNISFHFALTYDEETTMSGAKSLTEALSARGIEPAWVWIGEPSSLGIIDEHKGYALYRTGLKGVTGHSCSPDNGLNAIDMARQLMNDIAAVAQKRKENPFANSRFAPPYTTFNFSTIKGGTAENIIAENCELLWGTRAHPGDSAAAVLAEVESCAGRLLSSPKLAAFPQAKIETHPVKDSPPFDGTRDNLGTTILQNALKTDRTQAAGYATEAGLYQKLGAPVVICGPGSMAQAHQPNEFIEKNQLASCVDLMRKVLLSSSPRDFQSS